MSDAELTALQERITELLREPRALSKNDQAVALAELHISGNDRLAPVEQLNIYREQFWLRHTSALVEDFPGLGGVLGQRDWERLVEAYLLKEAPTSWTLNDLGHAFVEHVEQQASWLPHAKLCLDMARVEWGYCQLFSAPDVPALDGGKIAAIPEHAWPTATLVLSPALRRFQVDYPVCELRKAIVKSRDTGETVPIPQPDPHNLVLYRNDRRLFFERVSDAAYALLQRLDDGEPLEEACGSVASEIPGAADEVEANVAAWFQRWGAETWVVDVRTR